MLDGNLRGHKKSLKKEYIWKGSLSPFYCNVIVYVEKQENRDMARKGNKRRVAAEIIKYFTVYLKIYCQLHQLCVKDW